MKTYAMDRSSRISSHRERFTTAGYARLRRIRMLCSLIAAALVLLIILLCLLRSGFRSRAEEPRTQAGKYYTSVMITYDMSAEDYAGQYADPAYYTSESEYLREVCRINHLTMTDGTIDGLGPGNYIIIPYYAAQNS